MSGTAGKAPIGLFYGSSTCYTEMAAEKITASFSPIPIDQFNIAEIPLVDAETYDALLFGIPTWDYGELQEDWENIWSDLDSLKIEKKPFAIFALGDQIGYPDWFLDAAGYLHDKLIMRGALPCGYWSTEGYQFNESKALTPDKTHFVCLALDEENEFELSDERIARWCTQVREAFTALDVKL